jgi:hypothetical protein
MTFRLPTRTSILLAAAALVLAVASCASHIAPLSPAPPPPRPLASPFVLQALRIQPAPAAGGCPAGSIALSGGPGRCYQKVGSPVTFASAAVSAVSPPGHGQGPGMYGFWIAVPAAAQSALTAVSTTASDSHGYLDISVASRTWLFPQFVAQPFTGPQFEVSFRSRSEVLLLHHLLVPSH